MDEQKIIKELQEKYPGKKILINPGEIVCETNPADNSDESGTAVAIIDKSVPHYHKKTVEIYKIIKGELVIFKDGKPYKMHEGDELEIIPGEVHCAIGDETWVEVVSVPGWSISDVFSV